MILFNCDFDNTLIFSYKHDIGKDTVPVENYEGREISFMTEKSYKLIKEIAALTTFVPTTTRTVEQYKRIDLGIAVPQYALTCNGGVLLIEGEIYAPWYEKSLELIAPCVGELLKAIEILEQETCLTLDIRFIMELFIFTKSSNPEKTVEKLRHILYNELVDVFHNGVKVYVLPKTMSKGANVLRFREFFCCDDFISAGDSDFDASMLNVTDLAYVPSDYNLALLNGANYIKCPENVIFSDFLLENIKETYNV